MLSCLLLAAGQSQRFGSPKALAEIDHKTIIQRIQESILAAQVDELVIVLGAHASRIEPYLLDHRKVKSVYNKDHNFGQTSSFITGLQKIDCASKGIMLFPVDYAWVSTDTLNILCEKFYRHPNEILIPVYQGRRGHPPVFPVRLKERFLRLDYSQGINSVWYEGNEKVVLSDVNDPGVIKTFNTREEFEELIQKDPQ